MHVTKPLDLVLLQQELDTAAVMVPGVSTTGRLDTDTYELWTHDAEGAQVELPPEAEPVVAAHDASKPQRSATFEAAEDAERLRIINERARTDPAYAALAELVLKGQAR